MAFRGPRRATSAAWLHLSLTLTSLAIDRVAEFVATDEIAGTMVGLAPGEQADDLCK
jgi:hypothetical protein